MEAKSCRQKLSEQDITEDLLGEFSSQMGTNYRKLAAIHDNTGERIAIRMLNLQNKVL